MGRHRSETQARGCVRICNTVAGRPPGGRELSRPSGPRPTQSGHCPVHWRFIGGLTCAGACSPHESSEFLMSARCRPGRQWCGPPSTCGHRRERSTAVRPSPLSQDHPCKRQLRCEGGIAQPAVLRFQAPGSGCKLVLLLALLASPGRRRRFSDAAKTVNVVTETDIGISRALVVAAT